jgi:hypothetical protein
LYAYVLNDPLNRIDSLGLAGLPQSDGGGCAEDDPDCHIFVNGQPMPGFAFVRGNTAALLRSGFGIGGIINPLSKLTQAQKCQAAYTPDGDTKGENPEPQGGRYNTDLPGGYAAAMATFMGLIRLDAAQNGGDVGFRGNLDPRRATTTLISNSGNIGLRWAVSNGQIVWRIDIKPNTFSLSKTETIHFNGSGKGNMCPTR